MQVLTTKQIKARLKAVANWSKREQTICCTFKLEGFLNSIAFVNRIIPVAQNLNHYPDIDIRFDQVTLTLTTHDAAASLKWISPLPGNTMRSSSVILHFDLCRLLAKSRRSERNGNKDNLFH
jgi:4a-hydroxytetrahydrobiopterin dehydratase